MLSLAEKYEVNKNIVEGMLKDDPKEVKKMASLYLVFEKVINAYIKKSQVRRDKDRKKYISTCKNKKIKEKIDDTEKKIQDNSRHLSIVKKEVVLEFI